MENLVIDNRFPTRQIDPKRNSISIFEHFTLENRNSMAVFVFDFHLTFLKYLAKYFHFAITF